MLITDQDGAKIEIKSLQIFMQFGCENCQVVTRCSFRVNI